MRDVKTDREAVERLCERMLDDCNSPDAARYRPYTDGRMRDAAATLRALVQERDAALAAVETARRELRKLLVGLGAGIPAAAIPRAIRARGEGGQSDGE